MAWTKENLEKVVFNFVDFDEKKQARIADFLNKNVSFDEYLLQVAKKEKAVVNMQNAKSILQKAEQKYPEHLDFASVSADINEMKNYAILIMAGGEGERLRVSLKEKGYSDEDLADFTKATFPIPETNYKFGALEVNLRMIAEICGKINYDIPVIITTGPFGSDTEKIIPQVLAKNANFGVKNVSVIAQNERFHLTDDNKIVFDENLKPITNPDETGGPIVAMMKKINLTAIKIIVLQGTAVYSKKILPIIATAGKNFDGLGIGIARNSFPENDPYGTFVSADGVLRIVEKDTRTAETYKIQSEDGKFLPYNTGFYVFSVEMLKNAEMPDYATPPKIILDGIEKSPKIGYAATDIITFAKTPAVLTISDSDFRVIKNAEDIDILAEIIKKFDL